MNKYLVRLIDRIDGPEWKGNTYERVLEIMHNTFFEWFIQNDDNRNSDGLDLRNVIWNEFPGTIVPDGNSATVLEVLIALSERMSYEINEMQTPKELFWMMLTNLDVVDLDYCDDLIHPRDYNVVRNKLMDWVERRYLKSGDGNIFPLKHPEVDQRKVEIWYQMYAYIAENYEI